MNDNYTPVEGCWGGVVHYMFRGYLRLLRDNASLEERIRLKLKEKLQPSMFHLEDISGTPYSDLCNLTVPNGPISGRWMWFCLCMQHCQ
jgi:hypothetical protein